MISAHSIWYNCGVFPSWNGSGCVSRYIFLGKGVWAANVKGDALDNRPFTI